MFCHKDTRKGDNYYHVWEDTINQYILSALATACAGVDEAVLDEKNMKLKIYLRYVTDLAYLALKISAGAETWLRG